MSLNTNNLIYRGADGYSADFSFGDGRRVIRQLFNKDQVLDVTHIATLDEIALHPTLSPLVDNGTFEVQVVSGTAADPTSLGNTTGATKYPVRLATAAALAANTRVGNVLTADANGAMATVDSVAPAVGNRILVKDEVTASKRGIYVVTSLGSASAPFVLTRAADFDDSIEIQGGLLVPVLAGTVNGKSVWQLTSTGALTINSSSLTFEKRLGIAPQLDSTILVQGAADPTKQVRVDATTNVSTGQTRVISAADEDQDLTPDSGTFPRATTSTKAPVRLATAAPLATYVRTVNVIQASGNGVMADVDGVTPVATDRILFMHGAAAEDNGIYTVTSVGAGGAPFILTRATDFNTAAKMGRGVLIPVLAGTQNGRQVFQHTTTAAITINVTALTFEGPETGMKAPVRFASSAALAAYTRTGNVITANGNGVMADADGITPAAGDRMLLKDGAAGADNGVYVATSIGAGGAPFILTRAADFDTAVKQIRGVAFAVNEGTVNKGVWRHSTTAAITLNVTTLNFQKMSTARGLIHRDSIAADSDLLGNGADTTETNYVHTALTLPIGILAVARRTVRFKAVIVVTAQNAADTLRPRVRLGGGAGTLIFDMATAQNAPANTIMKIEGMFQIKSTGAGGKLLAEGMSYDTINSAWRVNGAYDGAVDTTAAKDLVVTVVPSSNNAGNTWSLRHFEVEVYDA